MTVTGHNTTMTMTGTRASMGTGTIMHRNTTMSKPTLSTTKKPKTTGKNTDVTIHATGNQASKTGSSSSSSSSAGAIPDYSASSPFAMAFGALAAMVFLH